MLCGVGPDENRFEILFIRMHKILQRKLGNSFKQRNPIILTIKQYLQEPTVVKP